MHTPEPTEEWLHRLVEELNGTPPGGWVAAARRHADAAPAARTDVVETTALLAAEKAAAAGGAEAAAWHAVAEGLAVEFPDLAAAVEECAGFPGAVAGPHPAPAPAGGHALQPDDRLGPFVVVEYVAGGGMGEVYKARQDDLDRTVALKVIRAGTVGPLTRARFLRERLALARLHQSNIVPVYYAGTAGDLLYYAMQYVPGAPLSRVVTAVYQRASTDRKSAQTPPLSEVVGSLLKPEPSPKAQPAAPTSDVTQVATQTGPAARYEAPAVPVWLSADYFESVAVALAQAADAIQHGHEAGILHRDIKPSNLILDARGVCMVIDYGLARGCGAAPFAPPTDAAEGVLTHGGVGTPQYMAPEQFDGDADARADVWGLGVTLYELLTLRPAFAPGRWVDVQQSVKHATPPAARKSSPTAPPDLVAICGKAMAKKAADRYQSAAEFAADLRRWLGWQPTAARPGWGTLRPLRLWACRHKGAAVAALLAVASLVASAAAVTATTRADTEAAKADAAGARAAAEGARADAADARAEGAAEKEKRAAAEAQADESRRAAALAEAGELRRGRPFTGWSAAVRAKLDAARQNRHDDAYTDAYAATLTGPDARILREYAHPEYTGPRGGKPVGGFGAAAFGPDGRLALGGFGATLGAVLDLNQKGDPAFTARDGGGPVAWADAGTPLQLLEPRAAPAFVLWHLTESRAVAELPLPGRAVPPLFASALSANGRRAAFTVGVAGPWWNPAAVTTPTTVVWDVDPKAAAAAPREVARWDRSATALAFSPDGRFLAVGTDDGTVAVRDVSTNAEVATLTAGRLPIRSLAFGRNYRSDATGRPPAGPAGAYLLAAGSGSGAVTWDLGSRERVSTCRGASQFVNGLAFTPDGATLVTVGHATPIVWDVATGQAVFELSSARVNADWYETFITSVAVSADGRRVAVTGTNQLGTPARLRVFEFEADRGVAVYRGLSGMCQQTWLSPSAGLVAGLTDDWQLGVWDRESGQLRRVWDVPGGWTTDNADVAFDEPAGLVYFAAGKAACQLNLATGARDRLWTLPKGLNDGLAVRPGRPPALTRRELTAPDVEFPTRPLTLRGRELLPDGTTRDTFPGYQPAFGRIEGIRLKGGGKYLHVNYDGTRPAGAPWLLDAATGRPVAVEPPAGVVLTTIEGMSSDGTRLFAGGTVNGGPAALLQFRFPAMTLLRSDPGFVGWNIQFDDSGTAGVTSSAPAGRVGLFVRRTGESRPVAVLDPGHEPVAHRLSPDGRYASWGREDGSVRVADLPRALERLAALTGR